MNELIIAEIAKNLNIYAEDVKYYVQSRDVLIGVQWFNEFKQVLAEIRNVMIEDRLKLHKVEEFLKEKKER